MSGVLCHLDEVFRQPQGREFPPPDDIPVGVDLSPPLGPGLLSHRCGRPVASDLVGVGSSTSGKSTPFQTITVVTVDGDPLARRALRLKLAPEADLELVGEAADPSAGVDLVSEHQPDLALIAVTGRDPHSSDRIAEMFTASPHTHIIVLTIERDEDAQMQFLRAGAAGCLIKSVDLEVLPRVLRGVHGGEAAVPRSMCKRVVREAIGLGRIDHNRLRPVRSSLTGREWEVVDLLVEGGTTEGIAGELQLSTATVRTHIKHILGKLGVHSRDEAVRHVERVRHEGARPRAGVGRSASLPKNH